MDTDKFVEKVREEFLKNPERKYEIDSTIERDFLDAIRKVIHSYECPDCMFSFAKGHRT